MPTYTYKCPVHDEFEVTHSINECLDKCPKCQEENLEPQNIVRLISSENGFILNGSGWAKDRYS